MDRQRYFLDNRYNLKIFTARIGGFSILHWLEMVILEIKQKVFMIEIKHYISLMNILGLQVYVDMILTILNLKII